MPEEDILPIDFSWRVHVKTVNAVATSVQFFVRKRHNIGSQTVTLNLLLRDCQLRNIVHELVVARGAKIEGAITIRANNRHELVIALDRELTHRFINLMQADCDSRCDEARHILLKTLEPYLDAAEMHELAKEVSL